MKAVVDYYSAVDMRMRILEMLLQGENVYSQHTLRVAEDMFEWAIDADRIPHNISNEPIPAPETVPVAEHNSPNFSVLTLEVELERGHLDDVLLRTGKHNNTEVIPLSTLMDTSGEYHPVGEVDRVYTFDIVIANDEVDSARLIEAPLSSVRVISRSVRDATQGEVDFYFGQYFEKELDD